MDLNARLEANTLIQKITSSKDGFFDAAAAQRLIEIVPVSKKGFIFPVTHVRIHKSSRSEGYSPGVGNASFEEKPRYEHWIYGEGKTERVGFFKIKHVKGKMTISEAWAEAQFNQSGSVCTLIYDKATQEPIDLKLLQEFPVSVFGLFDLPDVLRIQHVPWKKPFCDVKERNSPQMG